MSLLSWPHAHTASETYSASYNRLFRCRFSRPLDTETFLPAFNGEKEKERERNEKGQVLALKGHPIRGSWFKRTLNTRSRW